MKTKITFIFVFFLIIFGYSQKIPVLKIEGKQLGVTSLDIKVSIVGNIATTTYDMLFYNPTDVILEGELLFPLGENCNVSRFALDVNGKLREAVVVDKELGRIAFESVVRRRVDPALLEKGTGNTYKARIYPIPAKGHKRVLLAYEQELVYTNLAHYYKLPLNFANKLEHFQLKIDVFNQELMPVIKGNKIEGLTFSNWENNFTTHVLKKNYTANKTISLKIPIPLDVQKTYVAGEYFYTYTSLPQKIKKRGAIKSVTIYWDASLSMRKRDLEKELTFLEAFFSYQRNINVHFISFSNTSITDKKFKVKKGVWKNLKKEIQNVIYDGATSFDTLLYKGRKTNAKLIFSDGITTLSNLELRSSTTAFIINSLTKANHKKLKEIAEVTNGGYINLQNKTIPEALSVIQYEPYRFLGYNSKNKKGEIYPKEKTIVNADFSIVGKGFKEGDTVLLNFGYGNNVTKKIAIKIEGNQNKKLSVRRLWAQKKLNLLESDKKKNKEKIIALGKKYNIVTAYTSLIVLETILCMKLSHQTSC